MVEEAARKRAAIPEHSDPRDPRDPALGSDSESNNSESDNGVYSAVDDSADDSRSSSDAATRERDYSIRRFAQGSFANPLHDLTNKNVIHQPIAGHNYRVTWLQSDLGTDVDAHIRGSQEIGNQMAIVVVQCLTFIEKTRFNSETGRRMDRSLQA